MAVSVLRYFEGGVSSVYLWDLDDGGFAGVVVLKKGLAWDGSLSVMFDLISYSCPSSLAEHGWSTLRRMGLHPRLRSGRTRSHSALQAHEHGHVAPRYPEQGRL